MSDTTPGASSFSHQGFDISGSSPAEAVSASFESAKPESAETTESTPESKPSTEGDGKDPHAVALGQKGGQASAAKRAAEREADEGTEAAQQLDEELKNTAPGERKSRAQERIAQKAREARELREQLAAARKELEGRKALEERLAALESGKAPKEEQPDEDLEPDEKDFETYADYLKAVRAYDRRQWERDAEVRIQKEFETRQRQAQVQQQAREFTDQVAGHVDAFIKRRDDAIKADPAFWDKVDDRIFDLRPSWELEDGETVTVENLIADEIMTSEHGMAMMQVLSENNSERFQRIASLRTHREIAREMAKVEHVAATRREGATAGNSSPRPKEVSKAPAPPRPVGGGEPATASAGYKPGMNFDDYARQWNQSVKPRLLGQ